MTHNNKIPSGLGEIEHTTYSNVSISNCIFNHCSDAGTTHPGGWNFTYTGNTTDNGGLRCRSRNNSIISNTFVSDSNSAVKFSATYSDTVVSGNTFQSSLNSASWIGISFINWGSESNNNQRITNVLVNGNTFKNEVNSPAIQFRHNNNGVALDNGNKLSGSDKTRSMDLIIANNLFTNTDIDIEQYHSGIKIIENRFDGVLRNSLGYVWGNSNDFAGLYILNNYFKDSSLPIVHLPSSYISGSWYSNTIDGNYSSYGASLNIENDNINDVNAPSPIVKNTLAQNNYSTLQEVQNFVNGKGIQAKRSSGQSTLTIDSIPLDGSSRAVVNINHNSNTDDKRTYIYGSLYTDGPINPVSDNTYTLGNSGQRWSEVYAANGTINTSDEREKTFLNIEDAEKDCALEVKKHIRKFQWNEALESKGDEARIHYGVNAQQVRDIFSNHGLDAHKYGLFTYDEWEEEVDEDGNVIIEAGNRYGIRYSELLCFIIGAI